MTQVPIGRSDVAHVVVVLAAGFSARISGAHAPLQALQPPGACTMNLLGPHWPRRRNRCWRRSRGSLACSDTAFSRARREGGPAAGVCLLWPVFRNAPRCGSCTAHIPSSRWRQTKVIRARVCAPFVRSCAAAAALLRGESQCGHALEAWRRAACLQLCARRAACAMQRNCGPLEGACATPRVYPLVRAVAAPIACRGFCRDADVSIIPRCNPFVCYSTSQSSKIGEPFFELSGCSCTSPHGTEFSSSDADAVATNCGSSYEEQELAGRLWDDARVHVHVAWAGALKLKKSTQMQGHN